MGEPRYAYYAEWEFPDMDAFKAAARTEEFMATGKDAMEMGGRFHVHVRRGRVTEPDAPRPLPPDELGFETDRLREGAAAGDDHAQPAGGA